jgi:dTDP-4-dehydrorhamnose 3,5-epimerase
MELAATGIADVKLIKPVRHLDARGFFSEIFREDALKANGIDRHYVQDNHTLSVEEGVVRGLHFQIPPFAQTKLVRVTAGAILDVVVDIRWGSPTYGRHIAIVLSSAEWNQLFIPEGFAHGYCTLAPNTEVLYKVNAYYSAAHDRGLRWNDPSLEIDWPVAEAAAVVSDKDRHQPLLADLPRFFDY